MPFPYLVDHGVRDQRVVVRFADPPAKLVYCHQNPYLAHGHRLQTGMFL
jgi:hypothetical protein